VAYLFWAQQPGKPTFTPRRIDIGWHLDPVFSRLVFLRPRDAPLQTGRSFRFDVGLNWNPTGYALSSVSIFERCIPPG
jgi:hypothetical protein